MVLVLLPLRSQKLSIHVDVMSRPGAKMSTRDLTSRMH